MFCKIKTKLIEIINGFTNVIRWFPVIWKDRDWDNSYMWEILNFKLRNMEHFLSSDKTVCIHPESRLQRLKEARMITDRLLDDDYGIDEMVKIKQKYDAEYTFIDLKDGSGLKQMEIIVKNGTKEDFDKEMQRNRERQEYLRKQDLERLGYLLTKYSDDWWD